MTTYQVRLTSAGVEILSTFTCQAEAITFAQVALHTKEADQAEVGFYYDCSPIWERVWG